MKKFICAEAQRIIDTGVKLIPTIDRVSDFDMKCAAIRSISSLDGDWSGDDYEYTVLYDSGHGFMKSLSIDKKMLYNMLPNISNFQNLEYLAYNADERSRLFISQWPKSLQVVEIGRTGTERPAPNLASLNDLPNLRALVVRIKGVKLESLIGLADRLKMLAFGEAADIENISRFIRLETLNYGTHTGRMEPLGALKNLKTLCIEKLLHNTLDGLEGCESLERLRIQSDVLVEVGAVQKMKSLKVLQIPCPQVEDISGLAGSPIEVLHLNNSSVLDFSPLADMPEMRELVLSHTFFENTTLLAGMEKLTVLHLEDTLVEDLSTLAGLKNLEAVNLTHCKGIKDFSPLYELEHLTTILCDVKTAHDLRLSLSVPQRIKNILSTPSF